MTTAIKLFKSQGYANTSVENIMQEVGIAKGSFYYYFKAKEDILDAMVNRVVANRCQQCRNIAVRGDIALISKVWQILVRPDQDQGDFADSVSLPDNRQLQERINVETINCLAPILAEVIAEGQADGILRVAYPLETSQFLLAASLFMLDSDLFVRDQQERAKCLHALYEMIERTLDLDIRKP